jgi:hypothetical protein
MKRAIVVAAWAAASIAAWPGFAPRAAGQSDLDAFMRQVLARRDENWKKLQQYILDEREQRELRAAGALLWGERREYTWYLRDGFFVRSPVRHNGVAIGEADRREYEADYLRRVRNRERRGGADAPVADDTTSGGPGPTDAAGLIQQTRQPQFASSVSFMRYRFDEGTYALAGREQFEGYEVVRVEYYPKNLFRERQRDGDGAEAMMRRLFNKVALVTMWIEPGAHQIVKTTFDNVSLDFLPVPWLVRVDEFSASMTMGQVFPEVWLPRELRVNAALTFPFGPVEYSHAVDYHGYRQAEATIRVR